MKRGSYLGVVDLEAFSDSDVSLDRYRDRVQGQLLSSCGLGDRAATWSVETGYRLATERIEMGWRYW